jgi:thymidylate synthase (FAD)|tara:strand:- start:3453 stop:4214 length:762 start_codon:yes stop_codon:yes gene_type:complete
MYKETVLDKGHVELVDSMGSDLTVCNSARVSFNNETEWEVDKEVESRLNKSNSSFRPSDVRKLPERDVKLIRYLAKHNHWTPFAHPQITLRIKAPISIRTQFFKHKQGFVENEVSRRYVDDSPELYFPKFRHRPSGNAKQGSDGWLECVDGGGETSGGFATHPLYEGYKSLMYQAVKVYEELIASNVAPEQARFCLPQAMYTEWYWTGSLAAYARFYKQRIDEHAQWEIQQYATAVGNIVRPLFPISWSELTS